MPREEILQFEHPYKNMHRRFTSSLTRKSFGEKYKDLLLVQNILSLKMNTNTSHTLLTLKSAVPSMSICPNHIASISVRNASIEWKHIQALRKNTAKMVSLTPPQLRQHKSMQQCHVCEEYFQPHDHEVSVHCHVTGCYRGAAHDHCKLLFKDLNFIPVIAHNVQGDDGHFIIAPLSHPRVKPFLARPQIRCNPNNFEKHMSFSIGPW